MNQGVAHSLTVAYRLRWLGDLRAKSVEVKTTRTGTKIRGVFSKQHPYARGRPLIMGQVVNGEILGGSHQPYRTLWTPLV